MALVCEDSDKAAMFEIIAQQGFGRLAQAEACACHHEDRLAVVASVGLGRLEGYGSAFDIEQPPCHWASQGLSDDAGMLPQLIQALGLALDGQVGWGAADEQALLAELARGEIRAVGQIAEPQT